MIPIRKWIKVAVTAILVTLFVNSIIQSSSLFTKADIKHSMLDYVISIKILSPHHRNYGRELFAIPAAFGLTLHQPVLMGVMHLDSVDVCKSFEMTKGNLTNKDKTLIQKSVSLPSDEASISKEPQPSTEVPWLALFQRGGCPFDAKVSKVEKSGYKAAVLYNPLHASASDPPDIQWDAPIRMMPTRFGPSVNIPSMFLTHAQVKYLIDGGDIASKHAFVVQLARVPWDEFRLITPEHSYKHFVSTFLFALSLMLLLASLIVSLGVVWGLTRNYMIYGRFIVDPDEPTPIAPKLDRVDFPLKRVSTQETIAENCPCCAICIDDFESGVQARLLPCGHLFHDICVDPWLLRHNRLCPICKQDVVLLQEQQQKERQIDAQELGDFTQAQVEELTFRQRLLRWGNRQLGRWMGINRYTQPVDHVQ